MASYKQPCMQCGALIDRDVQFCPSCGSMNAFGYHCPSCMKKIEKGQRICSECGRQLYVNCPHCYKPTFVQEKCENCGKGLTIQCTNSRCGALQFFDSTKCTACGKAIKSKTKSNRRK